jgi:hypothetical protein
MDAVLLGFVMAFLQPADTLTEFGGREVLRRYGRRPAGM